MSLSAIHSHSTTITLRGHHSVIVRPREQPPAATVNDLPEGSGQSGDSQGHGGSFGNG